MFQEHHVLPEKFADHEVIRLLGERFNLDAVRNLVALPSKQPLAAEFGSSPHTGGHLSSYYEGFYDYLEKIRVSARFDVARAGDARALDEIASDVNAIVAAAKYAVANGHLLPNTPEDMTQGEANGVNSRWFSDSTKFASDNAEPIRQMQETVDQYSNAGQRDAAVYVPILLPTSTLSAAERIEALNRFRRGGSPISLQFTDSGPVPDLPGLVPPRVDTRLPGFIPPYLEGTNTPEGLTRSDPRFAGGPPPSQMPSPNEQRLGQLPPSTATPPDPLVLKFDPATGAPLPFHDNPLTRDASAGSSSLTQDILPWLAGGIVLGAAAPFAPGWLAAMLAIVAASRAASARDANSGAASGMVANDGGVFSTGAPAYDAFTNGMTAGNIGGGLGYSPSSTHALPGIGSAQLDQDATRAGTFADRFGNWISAPNGIKPADKAPELFQSAPAAEAVSPEEVRRLTRVNGSNAESVFTSGSTPVPYLPPANFNARFGDWHTSISENPQQAGKPIGVSADQQGYNIPPPIFGADDPGKPRNDADEWLARWMGPLLGP